MKYEPVSGIQPTVIKWARETVGLSVADVAQILKRPASDIEDWESGQTAPTYPQLEKLAYQVYKRPLAIFFLPAPPEEVLPQREFRTLPDADLQSLSRDTYLHIRRAHAYRLALKEVFENRNPIDRRITSEIFLSHSQSVTEQAKNIRVFLGIDINDQIRWKSVDFALKQWRKVIEDSGVFVFKAAFKQKDISGFCLVDKQLPIIYLNNSTTKTRQIFSLLHELAHLLLSINGLSKFNKDYIDHLPKTNKQIERFCNSISAEVLIPESDFKIQIADLPLNAEHASEEVFSNLANRYGVSREAVLRRLLDQNSVSKVFYERKVKIWNAQKKQSSGGDWYLNQGAYLSNRFMNEVIGRHYRHQITLEHAADLLGIKPKNFAGLEERILKGAGA
ncbi:MAG: ImmA/IrrE family metallo-endopeptidase [Candidatus Thiodiazotropha sp. (ex Ustalcina ferruginea)]|nr:ImmA/IrrE family metallo-endopeptidase [Candidatus Thiodiazotropha sp. (ex Ustalcina ferruginea)]